MNFAKGLAIKQYLGGCVAAWESFWFTPRLPHTLSVLRILTGFMLLYSHVVLASDLMSFLGDHAWINNDMSRQLHDGAFTRPDWARSYLWHISSPTVLWAHHVLTMAITASFAVGFLTRFTAPMAYGLQLMYLHRMTGTLFGLDQIMTYSAMYLMLSPCGSCYSVDAWLRKKWADRRNNSRFLMWLLPDATPSVSANIATRLLQLHLCVIYLFGGLAKARGSSWWDGSAVWYSVGNYEYQSMDMTWLVAFPWLTSAMTHTTLFWEIFYCALIWPKYTRPVALALAMVVHGGIALFLGMITFGVMMMGANLIFLEPEWVARWTRWRSSEDESAEEETLADGSTTSGQKPRNDQQNEQKDAAKEKSIEDRERRLRLERKRVAERTEKLKQRESRYRDRVERLKERELKIKRLVERRRAAKEARKANQKTDQD